MYNMYNMYTEGVGGYVTLSDLVCVYTTHPQFDFNKRFLIMMMIENVYNLGDIVYLKTDDEQLMRMVSAIQINSVGLLYRLSCGSSDSYHYPMEMTKEKSFVDMGS